MRLSAAYSGHDKDSIFNLSLEKRRCRRLVGSISISSTRTVGTSKGEMKTLTENQVAAGLLNDFIDVEQLEYFHLKPLYEVMAERNAWYLKPCLFNFPGILV